MCSLCPPSELHGTTRNRAHPRHRTLYAVGREFFTVCSLVRTSKRKKGGGAMKTAQRKSAYSASLYQTLVRYCIPIFVFKMLFACIQHMTISNLHVTRRVEQRLICPRSTNCFCIYTYPIGGVIERHPVWLRPPGSSERLPPERKRAPRRKKIISVLWFPTPSRVQCKGTTRGL